MINIKDWIKGLGAKKKAEDEWRKELKEEAILEAREEIKTEVKRKFVEEEKERLKSGKSKFLSTLEKEFGGVSKKINAGSSDDKVSGIDFAGKLEREFGGKKDNIYKDGNQINELMGVKKADEVINKERVDKMLGKSINTSNPQDKIGNLDFKAGVDRATPRFNKKKND